MDCLPDLRDRMLDLEVRHEAVLRDLTELEQRIEQALAEHASILARLTLANPAPGNWTFEAA